jgi:hypothetical protein
MKKLVNKKPITFPPVSGSWGTVTHVIVGGLVLKLPKPKTLAKGLKVKPLKLTIEHK